MKEIKMSEQFIQVVECKLASSEFLEKSEKFNLFALKALEIKYQVTIVRIISSLKDEHSIC